MLANPCGELRCSILSFLFSESSVRCFCHLKNCTSSPKSAPSVLCAGENPTFSSNLDEKGRKKLRAGAASAPGMYFLSCACRTRICLQVGNWVLLSSLLPEPVFAEDFTVLPLWALRCAAVLGQLPGPAKRSEKGNNFMCSALLTGPKKSRGDLSAARAEFLAMTQNLSGFYSRRIFLICSSVPGCAHSPQGAKINHSLFLQASVY